MVTEPLCSMLGADCTVGTCAFGPKREKAGKVLRLAFSGSADQRLLRGSSRGLVHLPQIRDHFRVDLWLRVSIRVAGTHATGPPSDGSESRIPGLSPDFPGGVFVMA